MVQFYAKGTNRGYIMSYQSLGPIGRDQSCDASMKEENKLKNRYGNIAAYDRTRVKLPVINEDPDTDYINANYVPGYNRKVGYIASQGPVPNSFISFWRMVWYEKVRSVGSEHFSPRDPVWTLIVFVYRIPGCVKSHLFW